jgi:hypothetical protein
MIVLLIKINPKKIQYDYKYKTITNNELTKGLKNMNKYNIYKKLTNIILINKEELMKNYFNGLKNMSFSI